MTAVSSRICLFLTASLLGVLHGCSHPLEIEGEGDIGSEAGDRGCSLAEYQAQASNCTHNWVVYEYDETYHPLAAQGWLFEQWIGCGPQYPSCSFFISESLVQSAWGQVAPPLRAKFVHWADDNGAAASVKGATHFLGRMMDRFHKGIYVYKDVGSAGNHFVTYAKIPDEHASVAMNGSWDDTPHSGATAIRSVYTPT